MPSPTRLSPWPSITWTTSLAVRRSARVDLAGIAASSGSACASLTQTPSATLRAIGCAPDELDGPLCFTLGRFSTAADVEAVLRQLPRIVARLRALAPLGRR